MDLIWGGGHGTGKGGQKDLHGGGGDAHGMGVTQLPWGGH